MEPSTETASEIQRGSRRIPQILFLLFLVLVTGLIWALLTVPTKLTERSRDALRDAGVDPKTHPVEFSGRDATLWTPGDTVRADLAATVIRELDGVRVVSRRTYDPDSEPVADDAPPGTASDPAEDDTDSNTGSITEASTVEVEQSEPVETPKTEPPETGASAEAPTPASASRPPPADKEAERVTVGRTGADARMTAGDVPDGSDPTTEPIDGNGLGETEAEVVETVRAPETAVDTETPSHIALSDDAASLPPNAAPADWATALPSDSILVDKATAPATAATPPTANLQSLLREAVTVEPLFARGSNRITPQAAVRLDDVAAMLRLNPGTRIQINGYNDAALSPPFGPYLGLERALSVKHALVRRGIPAFRLLPSAYGWRHGYGPDYGTADSQVALIVVREKR